MNDIFFIFKNKECSDEFLKILFSLHPSSKHTTEDEKQSTVSFLDVSAKGNDNRKYNIHGIRKVEKSSLLLFRGLPFVLRKPN